MTDYERIVQLRRALGDAIGLPVGFNGTGESLQNLSALDRERLSIALVRYTLDHPDEFTRDQVEAARLAASRMNFGTLGNYARPGAFDNLLSFVEAYGETAGEVVTGAAGVAGQAVKSIGIDLGKVAIVAAVAAIVYFGAPYVLPKLSAALKGAK